MVWRLDDPQGNEAAKIVWELIPYTRSLRPGDAARVLDLGCGPSKALPHFIGVDSTKDTALFGVQMRPDVVVETCERLTDFEDERCDAVFSSHLLEHIEDTVATLTEWWRVIAVGGHLILYLPHRDYYPNIGHPGGNPDHKHDFVPDDIVRAMQEAATGWDLVERQERNGGREYSFFMVFRKRSDTARDAHAYLHREGDKPPPLRPAGKRMCVVRYGGFGDMIQTAAILPQLKRDGWHVTVMTTPKGRDILEFDPHVDAFFLQDQDQVPNHMLVDYWDYWRQRFHGWVNLSESIEGHLLALPGRANHQWPQRIRQKYLDQNYAEWTAELAGVEFVRGDGRFYPSAQETADAHALKFKLNGFVVMFVMSGSSVHKFYPWQDEVIAQVLQSCPKARIVTVGDEACRVLEQDLVERHGSRVLCSAGKLSIRDTMALAQHCDAVWGPETGVLNSVANEPMLKVVLLSHSSQANLTRHWKNTVAMEPSGQHCYPCHQLHYSTQFCDMDETTGAAMCQKRIAPNRVAEALIADYALWDVAYHRRGGPAQKLMVVAK